MSKGSKKKVIGKVILATIMIVGLYTIGYNVITISSEVFHSVSHVVTHHHWVPIVMK